MSDEEEVIYCICRTTDISRFMIGCDHCEEWYHGDCINVTEKMAKYIKKFFCKECRDKNSNLKIVYKSKYHEKFKHEIGSNKEHKKSSKEPVPSKEEKKHKEKKKNKDRDREKDRSRSRSRDRHKEKHKDKHKDKKHKKDKDREKEKDKEKKEEVKASEHKRKARIISDTESDPDSSFNGKAEDEKRVSMATFLKEQRDREAEKEQQRLKAERLRHAEEAEKERERKKKEEERKRKEEEKKRKAMEARKERTLSTDSANGSQESAESPAVKGKQKKVLQVNAVENVNKYSSEDEWRPPVINPLAKGHKRKNLRDRASHNKRKKAWRQGQSSDEDESALHDLTPRQCYGIECANSARVSSKYCSDQCGLDVASVRIYQTLPERIREWNMTSCKAEEKNRKELEVIRKEIQEVKQKLHEVNKEVETFEATLTRAKTLTIVEQKPDDLALDDEDEAKKKEMVTCVSCGREVSEHLALRHMESCFNKFESQASFGSMYKTKVEGYQMFCDFYNAQTGIYCKRLRVICPEHTKEPKILDTEVCGFPFTKDIFKATGEFCRQPKKTCNEHYCWEKLRRAEMDMDRVRLWLKLDELFEKERQEKEAMMRRAGVLNLMLHSTFNHEIALRLQQQQQAASIASKQKQTSGHSNRLSAPQHKQGHRI